MLIICKNNTLLAWLRIMVTVEMSQILPAAQHPESEGINIQTCNASTKNKNMNKLKLKSFLVFINLAEIILIITTE